MAEKYQFKLIATPKKWQCPYCLQPVGILGNWIAVLFGTRFHGCEFSNTKP